MILVIILQYINIWSTCINIDRLIHETLCLHVYRNMLLLTHQVMLYLHFVVLHLKTYPLMPKNKNKNKQSLYINT